MPTGFSIQAGSLISMIAPTSRGLSIAVGNRLESSDLRSLSKAHFLFQHVSRDSRCLRKKVQPKVFVYYSNSGWLSSAVPGSSTGAPKGICFIGTCSLTEAPVPFRLSGSRAALWVPAPASVSRGAGERNASRDLKKCEPRGCLFGPKQNGEVEVKM